ncbi:hypothetical protein GCM10009827_013040 [Dactylosporangium maewongense]|uniref:Uncharacterized protein n=1 Tax=Dactylosporangium maewongense TaxID=634393 RepID=A0ABN1ZQD6_9ACTN
MRLDHPDDDEQRAIFEELLTSVSTGGGIYSCNGLDMETEEALWAIARAYPAVTDDLVAAARAVFAGQLDGSNAAARRAALARKFDELARRRAEEARGSREGNPPGSLASGPS